MARRCWRSRHQHLQAFAAAIAMMCGQLGGAQTLDPRVLQQLQAQLGTSASGVGAATGNPIDQSRAAGDDRTRNNSVTALPQSRVDTPEEQELRRLQSRSAIDRLYQPSPVEREFRDRLADPTLRQFGYDLFASAQGGSGGALTGAVSDSYIVGIGDDLVVQFHGATNDSRTARVDREGRLVVGALPAIAAAGRSLGSIRRDLEGAARRTLLGTEIYVSLGSVRAITVFVGGEVERPGQYNLTSLSDISAALAQAGGVRHSGSLRNVRIVRAGGAITVDLYGLLGIGAPPSSRLNDGDRIIVPVIGDTVAIAGNVARPGIYEIRRGTSVGAVLDYAGGALRPRGNSLAISRITADGHEQFVRAASLRSPVQAGDAIQLVGGSAGGSTGRVVLRGYVANPGPRSILAAPTVRDLLGDIADLRFDTYLPMAVLIRRDPVTAARVFEPVNLLTALRNRPGVALRSDDRLYVFSRGDIDFLDRNAVRRVVLGQPNPLLQCASLDRLEALVRDTQSARFNVVTRGSFIVERNGTSDIAATGGTQQAGRGGEQALRTGPDQVGLIADQRAGANQRRTGQQQQADNSNDNSTERYQQIDPRTGAVLRDLPVSPDSAFPAPPSGACPSVFEEEPELLPVLIENAVGVGGAVRRPGVYPIAGAVSARDIASVAEGILASAQSLTLDITRADAGADRYISVPINENGSMLTTTLLRGGDDLRFNAAQPQFESGGVLLTGEFGRPGLYSIRKGETLSQLIARAGGVTAQAYPYGTIFTRRSVKELQQEGLRRTGRELSNALLAVSARKSGNGSGGDGIASATTLIASLSSFELPGRVVIEADPRALALRPDLDTVLESGDAVYVPKRPGFVLALGDVSNPGALQFVAGKHVSDYLSETGGTAFTADKRRIYLVLPDGTARPVPRGQKPGRDAAIVVPPGSTIVVPKNIDPLFTLDIVRDVSGIFGSLITSIATLGILATR